MSAVEELLHFSSMPVEEVRSIAQRDRPHHKPWGFWVSVGDGEDGWRRYCEKTEWGLERFAFRHVVTLAPDAHLLRVAGAQELDRFTARYGSTDARRSIFDWIDWAQVARQYQGIIIAPYCWERRLDGDCSWYYTWDVASGCIWDAAAIASIEVVPHPSAFGVAA